MSVSTAKPFIPLDALKGQIPISTVAVSLLGAPTGRGGSRGLWWRCPFHDDHNPSFQVSPDRGSWRCFGCGESGDVFALVMRLEHLKFPQAVQRLGEMLHLGGEGFRSPPRLPAPPPKPRDAPPGRSDVETLALRLEGEMLVDHAIERLWSPRGRKALAYLRGRGLTEATIGGAKLGVIDETRVPYRSKPGRFPTAGITIPWFDAEGRLCMLKVRRPGNPKPKYHATYWTDPAIYPSPSAVRPGAPMIVVEGEFDALLLAQIVGERAAVVTLGSASGRRSAAVDRAIASAHPLYVATDADGAGNDAAKIWPRGTIRVRPEGGKDWTEVHAGGFGRIAYRWGRFLPLGTPPRAEDFAFEERAS